MLVVDDFAEWRRFVCIKLQQISRLQVVGEASDGSDAAEKGQQLLPDLVLLDLGLPNMSGVEVARQISKNPRKPKIIFVTENQSVDVAEELLAAGASGYVLKSNADRDLIPAITAALSGLQFVSTNSTPFRVHA